MNIYVIRNSQVEINASMNRVIEAAIDSGNDVTVISRNRLKTKNNIEKKYNFRDKNLKNIEINIKAKYGGGLKNLVQLIYYEIKLFALLYKERRKIDLIHSFDLDSGLASKLITKFFKKKHVYHIADFYVDDRSGIPSIIKNMIKKMEFSIINSADVTILCTEDRIKQIEGSNPHKIEIVHNVPPSSIDRAKFETNNNDNKITFTYVGGLETRRFINEVLEVFSQNQEIKLILAGIGELSEKVKLYSEKYENIKYLGKIDYKEALELYSKTDVMFAIYDPNIRNHKYAAPNKIYESLLFGKPIIVAEDVGMSQIISKYNTGWVVKYNRNEFENVLSEIINHREVILTKSKNAYQAYDQFSWKEMKTRLINIYKSLS